MISRKLTLIRAIIFGETNTPSKRTNNANANKQYEQKHKKKIK